MGCFSPKGNPIVLSFDCASCGIRDIRGYDTDRLIKLVRKYCKEENINYSDVQEVLYQYVKIDTSKTVMELGLQNKAVILIKLKSVFEN